jgi:release factor glutamine methyltransferase
MTEDELFLTAILKCTRSELYTHAVALTDEQIVRLETMRRRWASGESVQYICGFTEFMGHRMEVGPGVLVPRPETEVLVDTVVQELGNKKADVIQVLDIGTGSGCIPIALVKALPKCRAIGLDVSAEALQYARRNSLVNAVSGRIEFIERDLFHYLDETEIGFDVIISNPPYIPTYMLGSLPENVRKEPELALDGGPDGLHFYRFIVPGAQRILKPGGLLALEFGDGQEKELENLFLITGGWDKIRVIRDNTGRNRIVLACKI